MNGRTILHSDKTAAMATIEHLPSKFVREKPIARKVVIQRARHGIVLNADYMAKKRCEDWNAHNGRQSRVCPEFIYFT